MITGSNEKTMNRQHCICFLLAALGAVSTVAFGQGAQKPPTSGLQPYFGPKKRAVVSDLEVKVQNVTTTVSTPSGNTSVVSLDLQQPTEFGSGLTEMLITALLESKRFIVLDRKTIEDFATERALPNTDPATVSKAGRLLGAQVIVKGAVTEISFKRSGGGGNLVSEVIDGTVVNSVATVAIDLRIIDVDTGQILDSVRAVGKVGSKLMSLNLKLEDVKIGVASFDNGPLGFAVRAAVTEAVKKIAERVEKLPWEARIAEVVDEDGQIQLYLNAGTEAGLKVGDVLEVTRLGRVITDPDTGLVIGRTRGKAIGTCRIQSVEPKLSMAIPIEGTGFQREDVVRFPDRKPPPAPRP